MGQVAVLGVVAVLIAQVIPKGKEVYAWVVVLVASLMILGMGVSRLQDMTELLQKLRDNLGSSGVYIRILLKMLGITYVAELSSDLCRDAGRQAVAGQIEFYAKILLFGMSLPVLQGLLGAIEEML